MNRWLLAALLLGAACSRTPDLPPGPIHIELVTGASARDAVVRVSGLSSAELRAVAAARFDDAAWQSLLRVTVSDNDSAAVAGRYAVTETALEYRPRFPFDPGRSYGARLDPARLPVPRADASVTARIRLAAAAQTAAATTVEKIYPSAAVWPENMLRFYIHFSAPMSRGSGTRYVHLMDNAGKEVPDAILSAYGDLWNADATRLTVFFDPGRVKRGVGANVRMGRAIVEGRRYAITVDAEWKDANGQPLASRFERPFAAGPAAYDALTERSWHVEAPPAGARAPLTVTFPGPLDHALLERTIGVETAAGQRVGGTIDIGPAEKTWQFVPAAPWTAGPHRLVVQTILEDPSGNKIGRAFEVLPSDPSSLGQSPDVVYLAFDVRSQK